MAVWGYEFYLVLVLKVSPRYLQHSKIKFVSPGGHVISSICIFRGKIHDSVTRNTFHF